MGEPKGLNLGSAQPTPVSRRELVDHAAPGALSFPSAPPPAPKPEAAPGGMRLPNAPPPPPKPEASPGGLSLPTQPVEMIEVHQIGQPVRHIPLHMPAPPPPRPSAPPREVVVGGDPRAPAMVAKARTINATLADHRLFRNRLEAFLDLRPAKWATWAEADLSVLVGAASKQAEFARQLSLANVVKWSTETEQAYKKPPGLLDRLAPKPEFFKTRLEQSRDILLKVADEIDRIQDDLKERLERVHLDALVIQVATETVTDPSDRMTADMRFRTIVGAQQTAEMIVLGLEKLGTTIAQQKGIVGNLLAVTIPNWIIARSHA